MTRADAKAVSLAACTPNRLHENYDSMSSFSVFLILRLPGGDCQLTSIPIVKSVDVVKKLLEIANRPDFIEWALDPFTGKINVELKHL